jgi:hypothetical protein
MMPRSLQIGLMVVVAFWASAACDAPSSRADAGYTVHPGAEYRAFHLRGTHGASIFVAADADGSVEVVVFQRFGLAEYRTQGSSSGNRVKARFRGLGRMDMRWKPSGQAEQTSEPQGDCKGRKALVQQGVFVGSFSFRGESGYTKASAGRAKGFSVRSFREVCKGPDAGPEPSTRPEETLVADHREPRREVQFRASTRATWGRRIEEFEAALTERSPNLTIQRVALGGGEPTAGQFSFDHDAGTASVSPPEPFLGSADLNPTSSEPWSGDLAVSFLGVGEVPLAGLGFKASLMRRGGGILPLAD